MLKFITGNKNKFNEISAALNPLKIKQLKVDLDEIQDLDPYKVIEHKLHQAFRHHKSDFFIEDTSFYFEGLKNKLPGTFIKHFLDVLSPKELYQLAKKIGNQNAELRTVIAYAKSPSKIYFFESGVKGRIIKPKGSGGFGLDPIFMPGGSKKTLAELKGRGNFRFSQRHLAAKKLGKHLEQHLSSKNR